MTQQKHIELLKDLQILPRKILCKRTCHLQTGNLGFDKVYTLKEGYEYLIPDRLENTEPLFALLKAEWLEDISGRMR